jgi:hypothetical protein
MGVYTKNINYNNKQCMYTGVRSMRATTSLSDRFVQKHQESHIPFWWDQFELTNFMEQIPSEKLTGHQPVQKYPVCYGTQRFITAFTKAHHLSLF